MTTVIRAQSTSESHVVPRAPKLRKINLGPDINSPFSELSPIISPDGKLLFFTMGVGCPDNLGDSHLQDCYVSRYLGNGSWSTPRNLGLPINSYGNDAISGVSPDGSTLFIKNFAYNKTNGLCFAQSTGKSWKIDPITIEQYSNTGNLATQCISPDWQYIIFSAERDGGMGGADLYVSRLVDRKTNRYGIPQPLLGLNTSGDEFAPFLAPDGKTLYFSSTGLKGYGAADVFVAKRLDDTWIKWSTPKNLGPELNTPGMDAYYSVPASGDIAYFSSSNGNNHMDIYMVTLADEVRPNPVFLVSGKVINQRGQPLEAAVTYRHLLTDSVSTLATTNASTGRFVIVLPFGEQYTSRVESPGYLPFTDNLDLSDAKLFQELSTTITLDTVQAGSSMALRNIFFDLDKATIKPESHFELDRLCAMLQSNPQWTAIIEGHTDSSGIEEHNLQLSKERALSVVEYLRGCGINPGRLTAQGLGSGQPIESNATEQGKKANRRVVFRLRKIE